MAFPSLSPFVQMGMGLNQPTSPGIRPTRVSNEPEPEEEDNPPAEFVAPWNMNIAPETVQIDPLGYGQMATEATARLMGQPPAEPSPDQAEAINQPAPHSKPLLTAIETGYADKNIMNPVDQIRQSVQANDPEGIDKGYNKLRTTLLKNMSWGEKFADLYLGTGRIAGIDKMAADVIMAEMTRPRAVEAVQAGLLQPGELIPGEQTRPMYGHLVPAEPFQMTEEGMPVTSTEFAPRPAQPGQAPAGADLIPGARLNPLQHALVSSRLTALGKPTRGASAPAGLQEFNADVDAQVKAYIFENGKFPDPPAYATMVAAARKRLTEEPRPGSLPEDLLRERIKAEKAGAERTAEQTTTERMIRPHQIQEAQARTTQHLAAATLAMTNASDAVRKGQMATYTAELERARTAITEIRLQSQAAWTTMLEGDVTKEDKIKLMNYINQLAQTGIELSHRAGFLGIDIGRPNVQFEQLGPPAAPPGAPPATTTPPQGGVNPFLFAPVTGAATTAPPAPPVASAPPATQPPAPPTTTPPAPGLTPEQDEYNQLRKSGLSKQQAIAEMERRRKK